MPESPERRAAPDWRALLWRDASALLVCGTVWVVAARVWDRPLRWGFMGILIGVALGELIRPRALRALSAASQDRKRMSREDA